MKIYVVTIEYAGSEEIEAAFPSDELAVKFLEGKGFLLDSGGWVLDPTDKYSASAIIISLTLDNP